jgi:hypothetical protein
MKIIDNYRKEVGDDYTQPPNLPKQHERRLVNFFKKTHIRSIKYNGYEYTTSKMMVGGPIRIKFKSYTNECHMVSGTRLE